MSAQELQRVLERAREDADFRQKLVEAPLVAPREYDLADAERAQIILPNFAWLVEHTLAGVSHPRTDDAFELLHVLGIRALVSLSERFTLTHQIIPPSTRSSASD